MAAMDAGAILANAPAKNPAFSNSAATSAGNSEVSSEKGDDIITFHIECTTVFGDSVCIVGSVPSLGAWDLSKAVHLDTSKETYPKWSSPFIELPQGGSVEYKYVKLRTDANQPVWEAGGNRCLSAEEIMANDGGGVDDGSFRSDASAVPRRCFCPPSMEVSFVDEEHLSDVAAMAKKAMERAEAAEKATKEAAKREQHLQQKVCDLKLQLTPSMEVPSVTEEHLGEVAAMAKNAMERVEAAEKATKEAAKREQMLQQKVGDLKLQLSDVLETKKQAAGAVQEWKQQLQSSVQNNTAKVETPAPVAPKTGLSGVKLYYWPTQGRAQQIRLCLAEAGSTWEDVGFDLRGGAQVREEFFAKCRALGGNSTTNVPMLEMDGKFFTQSSAVLRLVARKSGLYPSSIKGAYMVDNIIAAADDLRTECNRAMRNLGATEEQQKQFRETVMPNNVSNLERMLGNRTFFVGEGITVADIAVFDVLTTYVLRMVPEALQDFSQLKAFCDRMRERPNIAAYQASEQYKALRAFRPM